MNYNSKWEKEYIENVDLNNIEWVKLNSEELKLFLIKYYFDYDVSQFVLDEKSGVFSILLGMIYLDVDYPIFYDNFTFLLGVVNNRIGKKTIVSSLVYMDNYYSSLGQNKPLVYISCLEVNSYFRNKGICKKMIREFVNSINLEQNILSSDISDMGNMCGLKKIFEDELSKVEFNGFMKEYHELNIQDNKGLLLIK